MEHLTAILAGLADRAAQLSGEVPPGQARPLPLSLYTSPDIHALECERIFAREWVCVGLAAELPDPGARLPQPEPLSPLAFWRQNV